MLDKNGIEIKTGDIVEITGAYFKNDNGLYFVANSPQNPFWSGSDHCCHKISKAGRISKAKHHLCFWPISVFVNDRTLRAEANQWNAEHAQIEVKTIDNMAEVIGYFQQELNDLQGSIQRMIWDYGEESEPVKKYKTMAQAYYDIIERITNKPTKE